MMDKTGQELLEAILNDPGAVTLDRVLDRDTHAIPVSDDELTRLVTFMRAERTMIDVKQEKKKEEANEE